MQDILVQAYPWLHLIGRVLFAMLFVGSGLNHLTNLPGVGAYADMKGVRPGRFWAALSGVVILAGGVLIALGWHRFIGAGLLVIFLFPAAFLVHGFWKETDPMARANEQAHFMKDLALAGAALLLAVYAGQPWPMSLGG